MMSDRGCAHMLFTRVPVPGLVKTRLQSLLSPEQCAEFQEALILDTLSKLVCMGGAVLMCCSDEYKQVSEGSGIYQAFLERVRAIQGSQAIRVLEQRGEGLGERMSNAFTDVFDLGYESCLLMGSDLPYVSADHMAEAERLLVAADVVFGPCRDGGYWLVGMKSAFPELFTIDRYGGSTVLADSLAICKQQGRVVAMAHESPDVDTPEDYWHLCACVRSNDPRIGAYTAAFVGKTDR